MLPEYVVVLHLRYLYGFEKQKIEIGDQTLEVSTLLQRNKVQLHF